MSKEDIKKKVLEVYRNPKIASERDMELALVNLVEQVTDEAKREVVEDLRVKLEVHKDDWDIKDQEDLERAIQFDYECVLGHEDRDSYERVMQDMKQIYQIVKDRYLEDNEDKKETLIGKWADKRR